MNPQWLRSFVAIAQQGSFTAAASALDLTQAAVSQHIRQLEDELGVVLLIRRPRRAELTPAGQALLEHAHEVKAAEQRLAARLADDEATGTVGLITPGSVGLLVYPLLLDLQERRPGLVLRHRFAPDEEVLDAVLGDRFELGLLTARPDNPRLTASPFTDEPLELVAPAGVTVGGWGDLQRLGFIDHPDGKAMAQRLLPCTFPGNPGLGTIPMRGFTNQVGLILEPVARGLGFSVLPRYARQAFARPGAIQVVEARKPVLDTLWLVHRAEWPLSTRARLVADHLRSRVPPSRRS